MDEERKNGPSISDLTGVARFTTIGGPAAAAIIIIAVFVFLIVLSTPGLSGQQGDNVAVISPSTSPSFAPVPKGNINFYCQYDPKWTSSECNITAYGCDPTAIAIILASFGDKQWTPSEVALKNGMKGCGGAVDTNQTVDILRWVKTQGYEVAGLYSDKHVSYLVSDNKEFNFSLAKSYLDSGYLIHAGAFVTFKSGGIKREGHSFVITDVNPATKEITAYDPTYCFTDSDSGIRNVAPSDIGGEGTSDTWYWAFPVKKEGQVIKEIQITK